MPNPVVPEILLLNCIWKLTYPEACGVSAHTSSIKWIRSVRLACWTHFSTTLDANLCWDKDRTLPRTALIIWVLSSWNWYFFFNCMIHILDFFFKKITMYYGACFAVFGCTKDIVCKHLSRIRVVSLSHCFQLYNTMITLILTLHTYTNTWVCRLV